MVYLKAMVAINAKAVNEMLTTLAAAALRGASQNRSSMTGEEAAKVAIECAEKLLSVTLAAIDSDDGDDDGENENG